MNNSGAVRLVVLTVGVAFADCLFAGLPSLPRLGDEIFCQGFALQPGGGALTTAIGLARLGVRVGVASAVGDDPFGALILARLKREGVDTRYLRVIAGASTNVTVALTYPNDRAFVTHRSLGLETVRATPDLLNPGGAAHVHVVEFGEGTIELLARAKCAGHSTSLGVGAQTARTYANRASTLLANVDLLFANEREALLLSGRATLDEALAELAGLVPLVVVTCGPAGAELASGTKRLQAPAFPANPVDTTGAGDAFNAGFLAAWLARRPLAECLTWGNACGAVSTHVLGGCDGLPTADELAALIQMPVL